MGEKDKPNPNPNHNPNSNPNTEPRPVGFDPSRMIGIIRRKALIKDLAAVYHAECLACCQDLLQLQRKWDEPYIDNKTSEDVRKEMTRQPKRLKKTR